VANYSSTFLKKVNNVPVALYPNILSVFDVWQNALAGMKNRRAIVAQCADWLRESTKPFRGVDEPSRWSELKSWRLRGISGV
jgi:hypothetical protein